MELSLAHEASQRTLKQRNLLALICIVLGILVVVMFTAASTRDREVVLQPILPSEMTLSSSSVTPEYLEAVTRDTAQLALIQQAHDARRHGYRRVLRVASGGEGVRGIVLDHVDAGLGQSGLRQGS